MSLILGIILAIVLAPILFIGAMSLLGVAIENRKAWAVASVIVVSVILFAGLTTWS